MLRTKLCKLPALALAVALFVGSAVPAGASENEELYFEALNMQVISNVSTSTVVKGRFQVNASCKAYSVYDDISYVYNTISTGTVKFVEFKVNNGTQVKKGDTIAEVTVSVEETDLDELALEIATAEENLENYIDVNKALLKKYENLSKNGATAEERRTAELLYDRLSVEYEAERKSRQRNVESLQTRYNESMNKSGTRYITATSDGIINQINRFRKGDTVSMYSFICAIYDTDEVRFRVAGGNDELRYNMPVVISQGTGASLVEVEGRVSSSKSATLATNLIGSDDYIEVVGDAGNLKVGDEVIIKFQTISMDNALIVDKKAVYSDNKGTYVFLYKNGSSIKRYILTGASNANEYWVVDGLSEGDIVILK